MLRYMTKHAIFNKGMLLAAGIPIFMFYYELFAGQGFLYTIQSSGMYDNGVVLMLNVFALSVYIIFAGMFPGIPYGFSLLEERNSGYIRFILQRISAKRYIVSKILTVGLSGAASTLIPYLVLVVPIRILTANSTIGYDSGGFADLTIWEKVSTSCGDDMVFLLRGILLVLFGILWAEVTLLLSLFVRNKYIAFVMPFVLFQLLWIFFKIRTLNPVYLIRSDFTVYEMSLFWPFMVFLIYIVLVIIGIYFVFRKQVRDEKI